MVMSDRAKSRISDIKINLSAEKSIPKETEVRNKTG